MNYRQNVPPGCHPDDTGPGGEDTYECACCGRGVEQSELDDSQNEPTCKSCTEEMREQTREEDAEVRAAQAAQGGAQ